ncbi:hypothetical protein P4O66_015678 [Electrophorus voltai]|uniref:Uncharacterized protein n=1 Tax=Electrophorus voltai TaxID=2609070 RepID=A0AAD8YZE4_9TELE|nr:hypothetical protein P4O66_015678 [Electrophorus voltai]
MCGHSNIFLDGTLSSDRFVRSVRCRTISEWSFLRNGRRTLASKTYWLITDMQLVRVVWALAAAATGLCLVVFFQAHYLREGQLVAGTCEIVTLDRDSSQPRRTVARQTARCACRKGQIAGTTRATPACVDGVLTSAGVDARRVAGCRSCSSFFVATAIRPTCRSALLSIGVIEAVPDHYSRSSCGPGTTLCVALVVPSQLSCSTMLDPPTWLTADR